MNMPREKWHDKRRVDCVVIGGGPAGLTAALYLARFRLTVQVIDRGAGRAASIPLTSGRDLVQRIGEQAVRYGAEIVAAEVLTVERSGDIFVCRTANGLVEASTVILATGIRDVRPPIDDDLHDAALAAGLIRYCPVCDGLEVTGRRVAVIGSGAHAAREAQFIRSYTDDVTLLSWQGTTGLDAAQRADLSQAGIMVVDQAVASARILDSQLLLATDSGALAFDAVYPALGAQVASWIAQDLSARVNGEGYLHVDEHQRTDVPGLYAVGDVVAGLNQISRATGQAAMRNDLSSKVRAAATGR
jgi:thioredoxin reductase (NADPH)